MHHENQSEEFSKAISALQQTGDITINKPLFSKNRFTLVFKENPGGIKRDFDEELGKLPAGSPDRVYAAMASSFGSPPKEHIRLRVQKNKVLLEDPISALEQAGGIGSVHKHKHGDKIDFVALDSETEEMLNALIEAQKSRDSKARKERGFA